jgi:hypothetical protein
MSLFSRPVQRHKEGIGLMTWRRHLNVLVEARVEVVEGGCVEGVRLT